MKKGGIIAIVVLAVALMVGGWYWFGNRQVEKIVNEETGITELEKENDNQMTFMELLKSNQSQMCTFSSQDPKFEGKVYMGDGKAKSVYELEIDGQKYTNNMLVTDGQTAYVWMNGQARGLKMSLDETTAAPENGTETDVTDTRTTEMNLDERMSYKCEPWTVDVSEFALPEGITFADLKETMGGTMGESERCAACDFLPVAERQECKDALSCE